MQRLVTLTIVSVFYIVTLKAQSGISEFLQSGNAHQSAREFKQAIDDYSKAIKLDQQNADAYYYRGNTFFVQWF